MAGILHNITNFFLLVSLLTAQAARDELPESVVQQILADTPQVVLIQTTNNGVLSSTLQVPCGTDTYYDTNAIVLEVQRTVDPTATAIGAAKGDVIEVCNTVEFATYEKEWNDEDCEAATDPGRKDEGYCAIAYLTPAMDPSNPYRLAAGVRSFEEQDPSVCEEAAAKANCPAGGTSIGNSSGGGSNGEGESGSDSDANNNNNNSGGSCMSFGVSIAIATLSIAVLSW